MAPFLQLFLKIPKPERKLPDEKIENRVPSKTFTIENHLAQLNAMEDYNIYKNYNK